MKLENMCVESNGKSPLHSSTWNRECLRLMYILAQKVQTHKDLPSNYLPRYSRTTRKTW